MNYYCAIFQTFQTPFRFFLFLFLFFPNTPDGILVLLVNYSGNNGLGEEVLKTCWRRLFFFQDVFKTYLQDDFLRTSWRRCLVNTSWRSLVDDLKTSWERKNCYAGDFFKTCLILLQDVLENKNCLLGKLKSKMFDFQIR